MSSEALLSWLQAQPNALFQFRHGIEKEGLRVDSGGHISQTDHPHALGSALTHPNVTTDYSEALLEFITPVVSAPEDSLGWLEHLHEYTYTVNPDEYIWPASMPAVLDGELSVRIAEYGDSHSGRLKHAYRHGLWHRYGRIMQTIAGLHFNYSMPDDFWAAYQDFKQDDRTPKDFRSAAYFGLIRHFRRHSWLLLYLFGASPAVDRTFMRQGSARMTSLGDDTLYQQTATSLRMSDIGYNNTAQQSLKVCFNSLPTFIKTLRQAMNTPYPLYEAIGVQENGQYKQLSANILQIENEYYSDIRPKRTTQSGEKPLAALERDGVEYVEVRCLDLNPYLPVGVDADQIRFLNWYLFWCLTADSPPISDVECERVGFNQRLTVLYGRDPALRLVGADSVRTLRDWGGHIMDEIEALVRAVAPPDETAVLGALARYRSLLEHPEQTPSGRLYEDMVSQNKGFREVVIELAKHHRESLQAQALTDAQIQQFKSMAEQSWNDQAALEETTIGSFTSYVSAFLAK